ncbi:hypothetical protein BDZ91DRAFT_788994 [Kalaharituber pfeilii]|nr:hypothetical protein BDZ91DRAFT_788994 [Kalaharituber pfeilii]
MPPHSLCPPQIQQELPFEVALLTLKTRSSGTYFNSQDQPRIFNNEDSEQTWDAFSESSVSTVGQGFKGQYHSGCSPVYNRFWKYGKEFGFKVQLPTPRSVSNFPLFQSHARYASVPQVNYSENNKTIYTKLRCVSMMSVLPSPTAASVNLLLDIPPRKLSLTSSEDSYDSQSKAPKSPVGNRLTSLFRWQSVSSHESNTTVSARAPSPSLSPKTLGPSFKSVPPMIDTLRANTAHNTAFVSDSALSLPPLTSSYESLEEELRAVSADLAASIKREMELEDLVEKLEAEAVDAGAANNREKRTSDYFSDVGTPDRGLDSPSKHEQELEKLKRQYEQGKAQMRLEMLEKLSEERHRRIAAETQMRELEDQVSRGDISQLISTDAGKVAKLEHALEDARRKLTEEKLARENFEQLVTAIKEELQANRRERDRLRDDVVHLEAKVLKLEVEACHMEKIIADNSKLQQELAALRNEKTALPSFQRKPLELLSQSPLSSKEKDTLQEQLKAVEEQRDALQQAIRSLREHQKYENKQAMQKIKALELERDRALQDSPRKFANSKEITLLRREVDRLRQRAEDALDAKFNCERNLGSLKMDLERAEQETSSLRALLQEHDTLASHHEELKDSHYRLSKQVSELKFDHSLATSATLQRAYKDLQLTHELTLSRLDSLGAKGGGVLDNFNVRQLELAASSEESQRAMNRLRQSLAEAEAKKTSAEVEADAYKKRAEALQDAERSHLEEERSLSLQLRDSTERVQQLATQVQMQMMSNGALRERLAAAIQRGEADQQRSAARINELQSRLKMLEERVLVAQQETDDAISHHEEEIRMMQQNHSTQLTRLKSTLAKQPGQSSPRMPLSPLLKSPLKSPRLEWANKPQNDSALNSSERAEFLEKKVVELEKALTEAEKEMQEVVGKMNMAQIEVAELTSQRDEAARLTRKLQSEIAAEKAKYTHFVT